jgi:hypothetical protein
VAILEGSLDWAQLLQVRPMQVKGAQQRRVGLYSGESLRSHLISRNDISGKSTHSNTVPGERAGRIAKHEFEIFARQWSNLAKRGKDGQGTASS